MRTTGCPNRRSWPAAAFVLSTLMVASSGLAISPGCSSDDDGPPTGGGAPGGNGTGGSQVGGHVAGSGGDGGQAAGGGGGSPPSQQVTVPRGGISARLSYEAAYDNVAGGDWYRDDHNETATLAWGESYVMMSLAAMFRATGDPLYLERLAWHADGVLAQRDDHRGVQDYRGVSGACWQNRHYQPNDEPYCYVVHSGMIAYPMVELARLVDQFGLEQEPLPDGSTLGERAAAYVTAAQETVAYHDDQWNAAGYYVFRPDASFLSYPGVDLPLNQSNAMGRLLLALYAVTGDNDYLSKADALATRFKAQLSTGGSGEYLWNYWGGSYSSPGEDISHAAINVDFAIVAADLGVEFSAADLEAFARTFVVHVYVDDRTLANAVGGGATNGSSYRPQAGRWLGLTPERTTIYTAVRDIYDLDYPPDGISSGSLLYSWALLAEFEPIHCQHFFYYVDWHDPDTNHDGDWREATAYGANILTTPPTLAEPCIVPVQVDVPRQTDVEQYDGADYHIVASWQPTGGPLLRHVPYEPRWPHEYWNQGVLYQFADSFVAGNGIQVLESTGVTLPAIESTAPTQGGVGVPVAYTPSASGDAPLWWALSQFPVGARIDHGTGALDWTPLATGTYPLTIVLQNDWGDDEQPFQVTVE